MRKTSRKNSQGTILYQVIVTLQFQRKISQQLESISLQLLTYFVERVISKVLMSTSIKIRVLKFLRSKFFVQIIP